MSAFSDEQLKELSDMTESVVNRAVEKALLLLPEVVNSLYQQKTATAKIVGEFYKANPSFLAHKGIVGAVITDLDAKNPGKSFDKLIEMATPIITERIKGAGSLDMKKPERPTKEDRTMSESDFGTL